VIVTVKNVSAVLVFFADQADWDADSFRKAKNYPDLRCSSRGTGV